MPTLPTIVADDVVPPSKPDAKHKRKPLRPRRKKKTENAQAEEVDFRKVPELVREDVFLMDNKRRRIQTNLLANSLTRRLRQNIPGDMEVQSNTMQKLRRDSLKDFMQLDVLNKQLMSEMNWETNRLDNESLKLLRRQNQMRQQSANQQKQFDRMESMMRSRSGLSSASLPRLADSAASNPDSPVREVHIDDFPEFAGVDKDDDSNVKVFKLHGIFRPQNKYTSSIDLHIPPKVKRGANSKNLKESLQMADSETPVDLPTKSRMGRMSRKGLRVTWSSNSQYYKLADDSTLAGSPTNTRSDTGASGRISQAESREESVRTPSTTASFKSTKSDSYLVKKAFTKGRSKIETVGVKWKVDPAACNNGQAPLQKPMRRSSGRGRLSHNLNPVTVAMDKEGRSVEKMRWHVQKIQGSSTMEMYQSWVQKLESLKGNKDSLDTRLKSIPNRANLSVMTQPA